MDDIQEIVVENPEFESESIVYPKKTKEELKEMKKPVSNANKKGKIKGFQIDNIVVVVTRKTVGNYPCDRQGLGCCDGSQNDFC